MISTTLRSILKTNLNSKSIHLISSRSSNQFSTKLPLLKNKEALKLKNETRKDSENYWPHPLAVFASLTILYGLYWALDVQYRAGKKYSETKSIQDQKQNLISSKNPEIILTLGSPNSQKQKLIDELINAHNYYLIQTSQLFTYELSNPSSEYYEEIQRSIRDNSSISVKTTLSLIRDNMIEVLESGKKTKFLIDGFPQQMDQLRKLEGSIQDPTLALYFDMPAEDLIAELVQKPGNQDSKEVIQKKLHHYQFTTYPIVQYFMRKERGLVINCNEGLEANISKILNKLEAINN